MENNNLDKINEFTYEDLLTIYNEYMRECEKYYKDHIGNYMNYDYDYTDSLNKVICAISAEMKKRVDPNTGIILY